MAHVKPKTVEDANSELGPGQYSDRQAFSILRDFLQPDSKMTVTEAAKAIAAMLPEITEYYHRAGELGMAVGLMCEIARRIPYSHPSQIKLVRVLQRLAQASKLNTAAIDKHEYIINLSLPQLSDVLAQFREPYFKEDSDDSEEFPKHVNFSAFLARLSEARFVEGGAATYIIKTMKEAFESDCADPELAGYLIHAAAMWIIYCGQRVFVEIVQAPRSGIGASHDPDPMFSGTKFGLERWRFWRKGFAVAIEEQGATAETKQLAQKARDLMEAIEKAML